MNGNGGNAIERAVEKAAQRNPIEVLTIILLPDNNVHVQGPLGNPGLCREMVMKTLGLLDQIEQQRRIIVPGFMAPKDVPGRG